MFGFRQIQQAAESQFKEWPDAVLNGALLLAAGLLIALAFSPGRHILKAAVLAYVALP